MNKEKISFPRLRSFVFWLFVVLVMLFAIFVPHNVRGKAWGSDNTAALTGNPSDNSAKKTAWDKLPCGGMIIRQGTDREVPKIILERINEVIAVERGCLEPYFVENAIFILCVETKYKGPEYNIYTVRINRNGRKFWESDKKVCR